MHLYLTFLFGNFYALYFEKVIFHEISKRGKIKFLKDKQDEHIFEIRLDEIELHDDFSGVEKSNLIDYIS